MTLRWWSAAEAKNWDMLWSGKALKVDDFKGLNKNQKVRPHRTLQLFALKLSIVRRAHDGISKRGGEHRMYTC